MQRDVHWGVQSGLHRCGVDASPQARRPEGGIAVAGFGRCARPAALHASAPCFGGLALNAQAALAATGRFTTPSASAVTTVPAAIAAAYSST